MITCDFINVRIRQALESFRHQGSTKKGWYYNCRYSLNKEPLIIGYLNINWKKEKNNNKTDFEIVQGGIDYLNSLIPSTRKRKSAKNYKHKDDAKYGNFGKILRYRLLESVEGLTDDPCIEIIVTTNQPENKYFWGESIIHTNFSGKKKRKEKNAGSGDTAAGSEEDDSDDASETNE